MLNYCSHSESILCEILVQSHFNLKPSHCRILNVFSPSSGWQHFHHDRLVFNDCCFIIPNIIAVNQWMPGNAFQLWCKPTQVKGVAQDTSPVLSLEFDCASGSVFSWLDVELASTSWWAHQIIVRVARVWRVSAFTPDIKADNSGKKKNKIDQTIH